MNETDKRVFSSAVATLRSRLNPGSKKLTAQDFRHTIQLEGESVSCYIRRLERAFKVAYGRDGISVETRDSLLHGQLHAGLRYDLMKSPAVSGAHSYTTLCIVAKNEERRLLELKKRQQYNKLNFPPGFSGMVQGATV